MRLADLTARSWLLSRRRTAAAVALCWLTAGTALWAGNPRWVTGLPYFNNQGLPVVWYTSQPLYFTDPGDLSASVSHAAADAIVAAAAAVWNAPTDSLVLSYGGELNQHVSGANAFAGPNGLILPSDVQSTNYQAKPIAVIYDTDGSVTDLLLGNGASDPTSCRQNGVTESVDSIVPAGYIQHAVIVLNGRCTGPAPEQELEMQYQLMRAFGRVLGLGWSQTNDNVFTGTPLPTYNQALNWPIMHPIDIICGPYSYQCLPQPFTLRPDDISTLAMLYFIPQGQAAPGKVDSLYRSNRILGNLLFPTGQGMAGVNVIARRWQQYTDASQQEGWYTVSSVSGYPFKRHQGNPVTGIDNSQMGSMGTMGGDHEGYYELTRIPMLPGDWQDVFIDTEPVNPLYTGQYSVGPYTDNVVEPSGTNVEQLGYVLPSYSQPVINLSTNGAASSCGAGSAGTETAPAAIAAGGWWNGLLCTYGHASWSALTINGNRTFTVEVMAEDEQGFASTAKAMPVIGLWNASDPTGTLPTVSFASEAFNGAATGMTTLTTVNTQSRQLRMVIADQRGAGRPDFNYQARVLYANALSPAALPAAGGTITITGMGFRTGNAVTVNGVPATVSSWSPTAIVAAVPSLHALGSNNGLAADVRVEDLSTGGTTEMVQALTYGTPAPVLNLLTAPSGGQVVLQDASVPFAVQMLAADGITPMPGQPVVFTSSGSAVQFGACGLEDCTVTTNSLGIASTAVRPLAAGSITLSAAGSAGNQAASFNAVARVRSTTAVQATQYIAEGAKFVWTPQAIVSDSTVSTIGLPVEWQAISGPVALSSSQSQVGAQGVAQTVATIGPLAGGSQATLSGCAWTTVCASFAAEGIAGEDLRLVVVSGAGQTLNMSGTSAPVVFRVTDTLSHPVAGAAVQIYQTVNPSTPVCPERGRCPIAPVYSTSSSSIVSDGNGLVTVTPQQMVGVAGETNIAAAAGTEGFVSMTLEEHS